MHFKKNIQLIAAIFLLLLAFDVQSMEPCYYSKTRDCHDTSRADALVKQDIADISFVFEKQNKGTPPKAKLLPFTLTLYAARPSSPGVITIQNNSPSVTALNISVVDLYLYPGLTQDASNCMAVNPGATCNLLIYPGTSALAPSPITIQGTNTTSFLINVEVILPSILSTSIAPPSVLALSVNNPSLNPALTGNARQITIQNTGTIEATGLSITYPTWPGGTPATTASTTCGSSLAVGAACTITITPGSNATSSCNTGIAPTPGTIIVSANNLATPVTSDVVVLTYGCIYQGGYVYALDDTTPDTASIGGKVAGLINVSNSNQWTSTSQNISGAESATNGTQNTTDIVAVASTSCTNSPTNCAAFQCRISFTGGGYTDWYLPAICEEGYDSSNFGSGCGTSSIPTLQNMQSNLVDNGNVGSLSGLYWSSTENSGYPTGGAWFQNFAAGGGQDFDVKDASFGVRCSRALTL
jgi:hypothetical protein